MPWLDYVLLSIVAVSALISLVRGFVREAFSLAVWVLAFWVSWQFFRDLALQFIPWIGSPSVRLGVAFAVLMMVTLLLGGMLNYILIQLIERTGMSGTDRFVGMFFGIARGILANTVLVLLAGLTVMPQEAWWQASQLMPYFVTLAAWLQTWLPDDIALYFQYAESTTAAAWSL